MIVLEVVKKRAGEFVYICGPGPVHADWLVFFSSDLPISYTQPLSVNYPWEMASVREGQGSVGLKQSLLAYVPTCLGG